MYCCYRLKLGLQQRQMNFKTRCDDYNGSDNNKDDSNGRREVDSGDEENDSDSCDAGVEGDGDNEDQSDKIYEENRVHNAAEDNVD